MFLFAMHWIASLILVASQDELNLSANVRAAVQKHSALSCWSSVASQYASSGVSGEPHSGHSSIDVCQRNWAQHWEANNCRRTSLMLSWITQPSEISFKTRTHGSASEGLAIIANGLPGTSPAVPSGQNHAHGWAASTRNIPKPLLKTCQN